MVFKLKAGDSGLETVCKKEQSHTEVWSKCGLISQSVFAQGKKLLSFFIKANKHINKYLREDQKSPLGTKAFAPSIQTFHQHKSSQRPIVCVYVCVFGCLDNKGQISWCLQRGVMLSYANQHHLVSLPSPTMWMQSQWIDQVLSSVRDSLVSNWSPCCSPNSGWQPVVGLAKNPLFLQCIIL